jgi:hypothetical protein
MHLSRPFFIGKRLLIRIFEIRKIASQGHSTKKEKRVILNKQTVNGVSKREVYKNTNNATDITTHPSKSY